MILIYVQLLSTIALLTYKLKSKTAQSDCTVAGNGDNRSNALQESKISSASSKISITRVVQIGQSNPILSICLQNGEEELFNL